MKVVVALVRHETNTFSPIQTQLHSFCRGTKTDGPAYGLRAMQLCENTNSAAAAYLDLAASLDAEVDFSILANSVPSGTVQKAAFEHIADTVIATVKKGCDAVLLDLHGAMVPKDTPTQKVNYCVVSGRWCRNRYRSWLPWTFMPISVKHSSVMQP